MGELCENIATRVFEIKGRFDKARPCCALFGKRVLIAHGVVFGNESSSAVINILKNSFLFLFFYLINHQNTFFLN